MARIQQGQVFIKNGDLTSQPSFTAATSTNSRWIDGTASGSTTDSQYGWYYANFAQTTSDARFSRVHRTKSGYSIHMRTTNATGRVNVRTADDLTNTYAGEKARLFRIKPSTAYKLSCWTKTINAAALSATFTIHQWDGQYANRTSNSATTMEGDNDWTYRTLNFTSRSTDQFAAIVIGLNVVGNVSEAYYSDIVLEEVSPTARTAATVGGRTAVTNRVGVKDFGTSLLFAGGATTDQVDITHNANQLLTTGFTFSAWIMPRSYGGTNTGVILAKSTGVNGNDGWTYQMLSPNGVTLVVNAGTARASASGSVPIGRGKWTHCIVTVDANALVRHYINGVASGTAGATGALSGITTLNTMRIGNRVDAANRAFDGAIDSVRVFNKVLTQPEINDLHFKDIVPSGLVAEYLFDEASGTTALDTSSNENNGTITGATYSTNVAVSPRTAI